MTLYAEKLLPHNTEAEEALIGSLLIDGDCIARIAPMLQPGDFYRERNQLCYDAALALSNRNQAIDQLTLAGELARTERLEITGGMAYLSHLAAITPTSVHAEDYAGIVSRTATMRKLIAAGSKIAELGYSDTGDLEATLRQAEDAVYSVRNTSRQRDFQSFRDIFDRYLQDQASAADLMTAADIPLMTGFSDLDELLGGVQRSDLVILAARPSVGKSTLALNMAMNNAKSGLTCAIFSLEMTADQLAMRALSSETGIDSHRIRLGLYSQSQEERIINAIGELSELPIYIDDTPYQGMVEIRGKARRLDLDRGVDLIMVDYLQLVQGRQPRRAGEPGAGDHRDIPGPEGAGRRDGRLRDRLLPDEPHGGEPAEPPAAALRPEGLGLHRAGRRRGGLHTPGGPLHHRGGVGPDPPGAGVSPEHRRDHRGQEPEGAHGQHPPRVPGPPGAVRPGVPVHGPLTRPDARPAASAAGEIRRRFLWWGKAMVTLK